MHDKTPRPTGAAAAIAVLVLLLAPATAFQEPESNWDVLDDGGGGGFEKPGRLVEPDDVPTYGEVTEAALGLLGELRDALPCDGPSTHYAGDDSAWCGVPLRETVEDLEAILVWLQEVAGDAKPCAGGLYASVNLCRAVDPVGEGEEAVDTLLDTAGDAKPCAGSVAPDAGLCRSLDAGDVERIVQDALDTIRDAVPCDTDKPRADGHVCGVPVPDGAGLVRDLHEAAEAVLRIVDESDPCGGVHGATSGCGVAKVPPIEVPDLTPWASVMFHQEYPIIIKGLDAEAIGDALTFELHVSDWPGGLEASTVAVRVEDGVAADVPQVLSSPVPSFGDTLLTFSDVPAVIGADYFVDVDGRPYLIDLWRPVDSENVEETLQDAQQFGGPCTHTTYSERIWDNYDRDWNPTPTSDFDEELAWGAWKYQFRYWDVCSPAYETIVKASYGFGFSGRSLFHAGHDFALHFAASWLGHKDMDTVPTGNNYNPYTTYGHAILLSKPELFYRNPVAPNSFHESMTVLGQPRESCGTILPTEAKVALKLAAKAYPWIGYTSLLPDKYCNANWSEITEQMEYPGRGIRIDRNQDTSEGTWKQGTGYITTRYQSATSHVFEMELVGKVKWSSSMRACPNGCVWHEDSGGHYYEVYPAAKVVSLD